MVEDDVYGGVSYNRVRAIIRDELNSALTKIFGYKVLQFLDGTLIINPRFFEKIYEGYGFSISHRFESVASDSYVDLYFENPSGSGRKIYVIIVEVVSFAQGWIDIYRNNTISANGTKLTPVNLNFNSDIQSIAYIEYNGTYNLGNLVHNTVVPGGNRINAIGGAVEVGESVIIPEAFNFLIRVTNKSASASDISIRIIWWEE